MARSCAPSPGGRWSTPRGGLRSPGRSTLDHWIRAYRRGGFEALKPAERCPGPRTPAPLLAQAAALRRELPGRTGAQIAEILRRLHGEGAHERAHGRALSAPARSLPGPAAGPGARLRPLRGRRPQRALDRGRPPRPAPRRAPRLPLLLPRRPLALRRRRALPVGGDDARARGGCCARPSSRSACPTASTSTTAPPSLPGSSSGSAPCSGSGLLHSSPGRPQGWGKLERFFRTVREQFLVELAERALDSLEELNRVFQAWLHQAYHRRVHSETGETPLARYTGSAPRRADAGDDPELLRQAFLWRELRTVSKTATVSLHGNRYEVDAALVGCRVELLFDPFDLERIEVSYQGRPFRRAVPNVIGRHTHPQAAREPSEQEPPPKTGIDYLRLLEAEHERSLRRRINYRDLEEETP